MKNVLNHIKKYTNSFHSMFKKGSIRLPTIKKSWVLLPIFFILFLLLIAPGIKGNLKDNQPFYQSPSARDSQPGGPFESTNSSSRYTLLESMVERHSFLFTMEQAAFAAPDISFYHGKIFSLFTPGVSILSIPFYIMGKSFGLPQLFSYAAVSFFAIINVFLIFAVARKLGAGFFPSLLAGFLFLFGTNAFSYAFTFTQHHISTTCILLAILLALGKRSLHNNILLGIVTGVAVLMDIPNLMFMLPILLFAFLKQFTVTKTTQDMKISFNPNILGFIIGITPLIMFFGIYNYQTAGSYAKLAQVTGRIDYKALVEEQKKPVTVTQKKDEANLVSYSTFQTRRMLNGFYILLLSDERSWIFYGPIVLLGVGGFFLMYRKRETKNFVILGTGIILVIILSYAMFADPWGGWSFGARYLIPASAVLAIGLAPVIEKLKKNYFFIVIFFLLSGYSVYINTLGATTTNAIPPKVEAVNLVNPLPYTYQYNFDLLDSRNISSSLVYNSYFSKVTSSKNYIAFYAGLLLLFVAILYVLAVREKSSREA